jgi:hypothetical protein
MTPGDLRGIALPEAPLRSRAVPLPPDVLSAERPRGDSRASVESIQEVRRREDWGIQVHQLREVGITRDQPPPQGGGPVGPLLEYLGDVL